MQNNSYDQPRTTSQVNFTSFNIQPTVSVAGQPALVSLPNSIKQESHLAPVDQSQGLARDAETRACSQVGPIKPRLTDEERIRNKREKNRKAAANCRRRKEEKLQQLGEENRQKDEKLRKLETENNELKMTIASLQAELASLEACLK